MAGRALSSFAWRNTSSAFVRLPTREAVVTNNVTSVAVARRSAAAAIAPRLFSTIAITTNNNTPATAINGSQVLKLSKSSSLQLLDKTDVFIFDCDGVIWKGECVIDGIPETLKKLRAAGKKVLFCTNNSSKSRFGYKEKFDSLGLNDVQAEDIFSSSFAAAFYLEKRGFGESTGKKVYVIGEQGLSQELELLGIPWIGGPNDKQKVPNTGQGGMVQYDKNVGAVVVGFDRHINYYKIQYAQLCINENEGCEFIATNLDPLGHFTDAQEWAGSGSMVGAIKGCTGLEPTVVGKPSSLLIDYIVNKWGVVDRSRICMVGDRLETDVLFGINNGLQSLLVLSGVTTKEKLDSPENTIRPDFYSETINCLVSDDA